VGLLSHGNALAGTNKLTLQDVTIDSGTTEAVLPVLLANEDKIAGFQCDIELPEGVTIAQDEYDDYLIEMSRTTVKRHSVSARQLSDGMVRIVCSSMKNQTFSGNSGSVLQITLKVKEYMASGSYTIKLKNIVLTGPNAERYTDAGFTALLTVSATSIIKVTVKNESRLYGDTNPAFTYSVEGGTLDGEPEITCEATATSPVGEYAIKASTGSIRNKNVTLVDGTLTVNKARLTVSAGNYSKKQGEANPAFTISYSGFRNEETEAVLSSKPQATTTATTASEPGEYEVTVSGGEARNYDLEYRAGKLIVLKADAIAIMAKSYTREYGEANPAFGYATEGALLDGEPEIICEATPTSPVGEYPIVIRKGGVKNYNDTYVNGVLTITPAPLTVTAKSYTVKQGEPLPTYEVEYAGFRNDETSSVLTKEPSINCSATNTETVGTYDIVASGAEAGNYAVSYVNGTLTVAQADPVKVTARSYTRRYGEANPTFEYSVEGAALDGEPDIECEATATSPVGQYPIVISKGLVRNYNDSYVNGTLTVTKAPLTITARNYTIRQGEALPTFEADYSGFVNDETPDMLDTRPSINCNATANSVPGTYDIIVSGAKAANYEIGYVKGTLVIKEAEAVTVTARSYSRPYGDENPQFGFLSEGAALDGEPEIICEATQASPVGTYPIVIRKGGVKNFNDTYVNGVLTITRAPLMVSTENCARYQGEANPPFTLTYAGFKNNETEAVLKTRPTATTAATEASEPGEYEIVVSGGEAENYELSYTNGVLTVLEQEPAVITAKSYTREYGEANPIFEYEVGKGTLDAELELTCEATASSPVGEYPITIKEGSIDPAKVVFNAGTLTITRAPLTVSVGNYSRKQGSPNPDFELSYKGFKNDETPDVLDVRPSATTSATEDSAPGVYDIVVSGGEAQNYNLTYVNGKLSVMMPYNNILTLDDINLPIGDTETTLSVLLKNESDVSGFQCDLYLPEGVEVVKDEDGEYKIDVLRSTGKHDVLPRLLPDGALRILCGSVANAVFTGKDGVVLQLILKVREGYALGKYDMALKNIVLTDPNVNRFTSDDISGQFNVVPLITITAKSYTREYGDANPTFEYSVEGAALDGEPEIICEATATSPVGEYPIVIKKGGVKNYNDTYVNGTLTITKAPLTVGAGNYTRKQGEENPDFVLSYEGFKNNETEDVLKKKPMATTAATSASAPGEYDIIVSGGEAENYMFEYMNGVLTVISDENYQYIDEQGVIYELNDSTQTYTVIGYTDKLEGDIVITSEVEGLAVTSIGYAAFSGCSGLTSINIPNSVNTIGYAAFSGCSVLTSVIVFHEEPISIDEYCFSDEIYRNATLYVPVGCKQVYAEAEGWKNFMHIEEKDPSAVRDVSMKEKDRDVRIYDLGGRRQKALQRGLNIVNGRKVMVK